MEQERDSRGRFTTRGKQRRVFHIRIRRAMEGLKAEIVVSPTLLTRLTNRRGWDGQFGWGYYRDHKHNVSLNIRLDGVCPDEAVLSDQLYSLDIMPGAEALEAPSDA